MPTTFYYGTNPRQKFVCYSGGVGGLRPTVFYVPGGGWVDNDPNEAPLGLSQLLTKGWHVMAIGYRVAPANKWPAQLEDIQAALAFSKTHPSFVSRIDQAKTVMYGRSAGGLMALWMGLENRVKAVEGMWPSGDMTYGPHPNLDALFPVEYDRTLASPAHNVHAAQAPVLIHHGTGDPTVPFWTSKSFRDKSLAVGAQCDLIPFSATHHGPPLTSTGKTKMVNEMVSFFDTHI